MDDWDIRKVGDGKYEARRRPSGGNGGIGCAVIFLCIIGYLVLSKVPILGELLQAILEFILNCSKVIFIELPVGLIKIFFDSLPPIGRVVLILIIVLPIIIGIGIKVKRKIDKMN